VSVGKKLEYAARRFKAIGSKRGNAELPQASEANLWEIYSRYQCIVLTCRRYLL
jgi:hypothetical protein